MGMLRRGCILLVSVAVLCLSLPVWTDQPDRIGTFVPLFNLARAMHHARKAREEPGNSAV